MSLTVSASVAEFFQDRVAEAMRNQRVDTTTPTECYLVNLLADFTKGPVDSEPLALKLARVVGSPDERIRQLKEVGDTSLYLSGFFAESLQRQLVDERYYAQLGGSAYLELGRHFRGNPHSLVFGEIYAELGAKFARFVDVFAEVAEETMGARLSLVQLYERWRRTGAEWIERRLRAQGVIPLKTDAV